MMCRICFLDSLNSMGMFGFDGKELNIANIVAQHFWFEPKEDDHMSTSICFDCWQQIDNFHSFYLRIGEAQNNFSTPKAEYFSVGEIKIEPDDNLAEEFDDNQENYIKSLIPLAVIKTEDVPETAAPFALKHEKLTNSSTSQSIENQDNFTTNFKITPPNSQLKKEIENESCDIEDSQDPSKAQSHLPDNIKIQDEKDAKIASFMKLKCEQCEYEGETFADVKKHYETIHNSKGYVMCCKKKFSDRWYFLNHIEQHINPEGLKCEECGKTFKSKWYFHKHKENHLGTRVKPFKCDECTKEFHTQTLLSRHKLTHIPEDQREFFCDECKKSFGSQSLLRHHQRYVHEHVYAKMCDICAKIIPGKREFAIHQMEHAGMTHPELKCRICGAEFKSRTGFKFHMQTHTEKSEYSCSICERKFKFKRNLNLHIRQVHTVGYKFKCTMCDKAFKRKLNLTEHLTTHTGEKLHSCPYCPKSFTWDSSLHEHKRRLHPDEFEQSRKNRVKKLNCNDFNVD